MPILDRLQAAYISGDTAEQLNIIAELVPQIGKTVIELPCRVGNDVYINKHHKISRRFIQAVIIYPGNHIVFCSELALKSSFLFEDFGKTAFLSEAEAEKALKEREKSNA